MEAGAAVLASSSESVESRGVGLSTPDAGARPSRAILEVRFGPMQGRKAVIDKGGRLRVGCIDFSDFVVPQDRQMSGEHFELHWDGERCLLRDLGSVKGTELGGEPVSEVPVEVGHGAWIHAGSTDFLVHFEGWLPPPAEDDDADGDNADGLEEGSERGEAEGQFDAEVRELRAAERAARCEAAEKALVVLRAEAAKGKLYAVVDAARDERILQVLRQSVEEHRSLYEGVEGETMADVAPYLAGPMKADSRLLESLVLEGWGRRWGIYCTSDDGFREVRRHFRRFLMVEEEETGERMYFRFYDPAVMRVFLPSSTPRQMFEFGSVPSVFIVEGADGQARRFAGTGDDSC